MHLMMNHVFFVCGRFYYQKLDKALTNSHNIKWLVVSAVLILPTIGSSYQQNMAREEKPVKPG